MTNDNENQDENAVFFFMLESSAVVCARISLQKQYIYMR